MQVRARADYRRRWLHQRALQRRREDDLDAQDRAAEKEEQENARLEAERFLAEQERDQATIAAVGGSRRTRRVMVGAQTWLLAVIGVLLGGLVGAFPGISIARALTSEDWNPMTGEQLERAAVIDVPWLVLGAILLAVPLLAGLLASLMVRRAPVLNRRTE